jgi:hypothetical protein
LNVTLEEIGKALVTPLGLAAVGLTVLWVIAVVLSWRARRDETFRIGVSLWMAAYSANIVVAYLTPTDRDQLRLVVAALVGWNAGLAMMMIRDALVRNRKRRR